MKKYHEILNYTGICEVKKDKKKILCIALTYQDTIWYMKITDFIKYSFKED